MINNLPEICCQQPWAQNNWNLRAEKGLSDTNQTYPWVLSSDYALPFGKGHNLLSTNRAGNRRRCCMNVSVFSVAWRETLASVANPALSLLEATSRSASPLACAIRVRGYPSWRLFAISNVRRTPRPVTWAQSPLLSHSSSAGLPECQSADPDWALRSVRRKLLRISKSCLWQGRSRGRVDK